MTSTVDKLLSTAFKEISDVKRQQIPVDNNLSPDTNGCIYHIRSLAGNSLDICSTQSEAEKIARAYHEYEIWRIYVGSNSKELLIRYEQRRQNNAMQTALSTEFHKRK